MSKQNIDESRELKIDAQIKIYPSYLMRPVEVPGAGRKKLNKTPLVCAAPFIFILSLSANCMSLLNISHGIEYDQPPIPYGGIMSGAYSGIATDGPESALLFIDLPFSLVMDTILLPLVVPWYLIENAVDDAVDHAGEEQDKKRHQQITAAGGHDFNHIVSVAISSDARYIATGSWDGTAKIWSVEGKLLATLRGGDGLALAFDPQGEILAVGSNTGRVTLWNLQGQLLTALGGDGDQVEGLLFSPDGETLAVATDDDTVRLWTRAGIPVRSLTARRTETAMAFSADGQMFATGGDELRLWTAQGAPIAAWNAFGPRMLEFLPGGRILAVGGGSESLYIWDLKGNLLEKLPGSGFSDHHRHVAKDRILGCFPLHYSGCRMFSHSGAVVWEFSNDWMSSDWSGIAVHPGAGLLAINVGNILWLRDLKNGKLIRRIPDVE